LSSSAATPNFFCGGGGVTTSDDGDGSVRGGLGDGGSQGFGAFGEFFEFEDAGGAVGGESGVVPPHSQGGQKRRGSALGKFCGPRLVDYFLIQSTRIRAASPSEFHSMTSGSALNGE
jgi:hypothetical protein